MLLMWVYVRCFLVCWKVGLCSDFYWWVVWKSMLISCDRLLVGSGVYFCISMLVIVFMVVCGFLWGCYLVVRW